MLDHEDLKWIASTSTELNSMLQQVARYTDLARQHKSENNYLEVLGERVDRATKTAQSLFDRVTSSILSNSAGSASKAGRKTSAAEPSTNFSVVAQPSWSMSAVSQAVAQLSPPKATYPPPTPTLETETPIVNPDGARELILFVDDEVEIMQLASAMLAEEGYRVVLANDGFEALRIYRKLGNKIGLVILDFFLPVMDGDAVFDELRALNPAINVVLSSGFAEHTKLGAMLALGLRGFIPKPYTREKLLGQIRSTLDAARAPQMSHHHH
ncbi:MAG: response regulator [Chthoniobacterales bacterium]